MIAPRKVESLSVLVPVYNSEQTIGALADRIFEALEPEYVRVELVLVNDGSRDASHERVLEAIERHAGKIRYLQLGNNFGEHSAVMCGLRYITGDAVAIIDDDFQTPPGEILKLTRKLEEGFDVVYSRYEDKRHHWFRNLGSRFNDVAATWLLKKPKGLYLSSFKVMSAYLVKNVVYYDGPFPYLDGLILRATSTIGTEVCLHADRAAGRSNYTLRRLILLWLSMFTGFSITPLRVASAVGLATSIFGFALAGFFIVARFTGGVFIQQAIPPGWASLIVSITVFSGMQLCVLGLIGEYLGRCLLTINRTPQYIVRETYGFEPSPTDA